MQPYLSAVCWTTLSNEDSKRQEMTMRQTKAFIEKRARYTLKRLDLSRTKQKSFEKWKRVLCPEVGQTDS